MGLLFNTKGTTHIRDEGNIAFNSANLAVLKRDVDWANAFAALPAANNPKNPNGGSENLLNALPYPVRPLALSQAAWTQWLHFLDTQPNARSAIPNEVVSTTIGKAISDALTNQQKNFVQVEIFVVPDNGNQISAASVEFQDKHHEWSKIITIYTNTFDQLGQFHSRHRI